MSDVVKTAKVSSKGQITLPRQIRDALGTDLVTIVLEGGAVRIEPVRDLAGSLSKYARRGASFAVARERAWDAVAREKHKRR
jgi:AbrB family looped-hinge helix DNA binding protein